MQTKTNDISQQKSVKCKNCELRQKQAAWKRDAPVQLPVPLDDKDVWLIAFTDGLESLFATHPTPYLLSDSDTMFMRNCETALESLVTTNFTKDNLIKTFSFVFHGLLSQCGTVQT